MKGKGVLVLGGYGLAGAHACRELLRTTELPVAIAGRHKHQAEAFAQSLGDRARGMYADAFDPKSLLAAMDGAALVLNCAGPNDVIGAQVAEAALEAHCHYVDIAGYADVTGVLRSWDHTIIAKDLAFCTSAGLVPGISGIVVRLLADSVDSVELLQLFHLHNDHISAVTARDLVVEVVKKGCVSVYRDRRWRHVPLARRLKPFAFPPPFGRSVCAPAYLFELDGLLESRPVDLCEVYFSSGGLLVGGAVLALRLARPVLNSECALRAAAWLLRGLHAVTSRTGPKGFAMKGIVRGVSRGERIEHTVECVHRDAYFATGVTAATVARMILDGRITRRGVFYCCEGVDPEPCLDELAAAGLPCAHAGAILPESAPTEERHHD